MNKEEKIYLQTWLIKANEDFGAAQILFKNEMPLIVPVCFHCQQAVEKFLKAFLVLHKVDFPKTHNIDFLLDLCIKLKPEMFLETDMLELSAFGVEIRYPGDMETPSLNETKQYIEIAKQIKEIVEPIINKKIK